MSTGKLMSEERVADILRCARRGSFPRGNIDELAGHIAALTDALQARVTAPEKMLGEAEWLLMQSQAGEPFPRDWHGRRDAWLNRYDATHGGTPTSGDGTGTP